MKSLVLGTLGNENHEESVRRSFVLGYNDSGGSISESDVEIMSLPTLDLQAGFDWCKANGVNIMVCSYAGAENKLSIAAANYPDVTLFMPTGANQPGEIYSGTIPQVICLTGAGDTKNETADNVEFISNDPITQERDPDEQDLSSFSNGYIAGQIAFISDTLGCSVWEARFRAQRTGSEGGTWDEVNGFGFIDVQAAINYSGAIESEPFLPITCSLSSDKDEIIIGEEVELTWVSENALAVDLNGESKALNGSEIFQPSETTEYIFMAENNAYQCEVRKTIVVKEEEFNGEEEMTENLYTGIIKEVEILKPNGETYRSGLLTDANLFIKAEPIKKMFSGSEAVLGYDVNFSAEFAEVDGKIDDIKRFNNEKCAVLFDVIEGTEDSLQTLSVADGVFVPVFDNVRINVSLEADFINPGKTILKVTGRKRVKEIYGEVFIFSESKLNEIKSRYQTTVMDFNVYADLDMNSTDENYDFNN